MSKENMGIEDSEFYSSAILLIRYAEALDGKLEDYLWAVNKICEEAIHDQMIRSRLMSICSKVERIREPLNGIVCQAANDCKSFVKEVDKADQFLY